MATTATCPSGRRLTGGGFALDTANGMPAASMSPNLTPVQNRPAGQGWRAEALNVTGGGFAYGASNTTPVTFGVATYAVCTPGT